MHWMKTWMIPSCESVQFIGLIEWLKNLNNELIQNLNDDDSFMYISSNCPFQPINSSTDNIIYSKLCIDSDHYSSHFNVALRVYLAMKSLKHKIVTGHPNWP